MKAQLQAEGHRLLRQHQVDHLVAHAYCPAINGLLQATGFLERDHHARVKLLPYTGHGAEHGGRNFAHVLGHGFGVLDKVEFGPGVHREIFATHALGNVAQGQKAHALVTLVSGDQGVEAPHRENQAMVAVHATLGLAGGARGVDQDGQLFGLAGSAALREHVGVLLGMRTAQGLQLLQADDHRVVEVAQTLHVEHHNFLQQG